MSVGLTIFYCIVACFLDKHCNLLLGCFNQVNLPYMLSWALGLVLGDWKTGLIIGAMVTTLNMAPVVIGAVYTMNLWIATVLCVALVCGAGMDLTVAFAMAAPIAVLGNAFMTIHDVFVTDMTTDQWAAKAAEEGNAKKVIFILTFVKWAMNFVLLFAEYFILIYFGTRAADALVSAMPGWLVTGFSASGKLLPAVGIGIFLSVMGKKKYLPFFFVGAYSVLYLGLSTTKIGVLAACVALILISFMGDNDIEGGILEKGNN